jgi:predicted phage replisome organizer
MAKRYYWLKLSDDFFKSKPVKKLRRIAGGDTYTVIYLKMLLVALKQDGKIYYDGVEDTFADELALDLDEDAENVKVTIAFLKAQNLLIDGDAENEYILPECAAMTGTESDSAERMRRMRERKALQCNDIPSQCYAQVSQCDDDVTDSYENVTLEKENRYKSLDKDLDTRYKSIDTDSETRYKSNTSNSQSDDVTCETQSVSLDIKEIAEAWNELQSLGIKPISKMAASSARYRKLSARIREHGKDKVLSAIEQIKVSNFLQGLNDRGWAITFDWFVMPNNFVKVLDGNYSNRVTREQEKKGDDRYDGIKSWAIKNGLNTGEGSVVGDNNNSENSVSDKGFFGF